MSFKMKLNYPSYMRTGTTYIAETLGTSERAILDSFLVHCSATAKPTKVSSRKSELLQVRDIIEKPFDNWTNVDLTSFLAVLNHSDRKPWTRKCILQTLQMFIKWHFGDWSSRFRNLDTLRKVNRLTRPNNADRYNETTLPTPEDIELMICRADTIKQKLYICMAAEAGLPPKVQLNLKWKNLKIDSPVPEVTTLSYFRTKNREGFVFPCGKLTTRYLKEWWNNYEFPGVSDADYVFPSARCRDRPMPYETAWYLLKRLAEKAGLEKINF